MKKITNEVTSYQIEYEKLSRVLDILMLSETLALGSEMESIQSMGYKNYVIELEKVANPLDDARDILKTL